MKRLCLLAVAYASIASADPSPAAKPHVDAGVAAYNGADYATAIAEFELAYGIDRDPMILYALAQAQRLGGHCDKALELYRRYLGTGPTDAQIAAARTGIDLCDEKPPRPRPPPPTPPVIRPLPEPAPTPAEQRWYRDRLGGGLVIAGVAGAVVGATFLILSGRSADAATDAPTRAQFLDHLDAATRRRQIGFVTVGVGSALVIAGVIRYVTRGDTPSPRVGVTASGAVIYGRF